jgi:Tfp pilus assembly protein PilF
MAELYLLLRDNPKACVEYEKASTAAPKDGMLLNNYVYLCMVDPGKDLDRAIPLLDRALTLAGRRAAIVDSLGWAYVQRHRTTRKSGDLREAVDLLAEAVEKDPKNPEERLHLGLAHAAARDWNAAYVELSKALWLKPDLMEAQIALTEVNKVRRRVRSGDDTEGNTPRKSGNIGSLHE